MDLKEKLLSSFMAFEERVDVNADLHNIRTEAIKNFENKGFPSKKGGSSRARKNQFFLK